MSFSRELKDFAAGFKAGSDILYRNAARKNIEMNLPLFGPEDYRAGRVPEGALSAALSSGGGGGGGVGTTKAPSQSATEFGQNAYRYFRSKGLSHAASAGIVGNLMQESGGAADVLSGERLGDNNTSGFAAQWRDDKPGGGTGPGQRLSNLRAFAKQRGHGIPTVEDQLDFVLEEMNPKSPYVDKGAAEAFPAIQGAASVEQATELFAKHFERAGTPMMANRIKYASAFGDTGGGGTQFAFAEPAAAAAPAAPAAEPARVASADQGAIADEGDTSDQTTDDPNVAQAPTITAPDVDLTPQVQDPQLVEEHFDEGGVIDDGTQYFQGGGAPMADPYNPNRAYTQMGNTGYTPPPAARRITLPAAGQTGTGTNAAGQNWRDWQKGTPNQLALRKRWADLEAERAKAATPAAAPAAAQPPPDWQQQLAGVYNQGQANAYNLRAMNPSSYGYGRYTNSYSTMDPKTGKITTQYMPSTGFQSGHGGHAEGGMIYARGGKVAKRKEPDWAALKKKAGSQPGFDELVQRYRRPGDDREGTGAQDARDRAAREMNIRSRGLNSTAWREPYLRPAAAPTVAPSGRHQAPAQPSRIPTPTPRPPRAGDEPPPEGGRMPQVDTMGESVGANYDETLTNNSPAEVHRQLANDPVFQARQKQMQAEQAARDAQYYPPGAPWRRPAAAAPAAAPTIEVPPVDPNTGEEMTTQPAMAQGGLMYAEGGAIPDDDRPRSLRAESANLGPTRKKKRRTDPWQGMRTKTSKPVKKTPNKLQARNQRKQKTAAPATKRKGPPTPTRRPGSQDLPGRGAPIPTPRPPGGVTGGVPPLAEDRATRLRPDPLANAFPPRPTQMIAEGAGALGRGIAQVGSDLMTPLEHRDTIEPYGGRPQQGPPQPARPPQASPYNAAVIPGVAPPVPGTDYPRGGSWADVRGGPAESRPPPTGVRPAAPSTAAPAVATNGLPARPSIDVNAQMGGQEAPYYDTSQLPTDRFGNPITEVNPDGPTVDRFGNPITGPEEYAGYARGGAIPDDREGPYPNWRAEEAGYTTSSADPRVAEAPTQRDDRYAPAPQQTAPAPEPPAGGQYDVDQKVLMKTAAPSVHAGVMGLQRIFGLQHPQEGAIQTPESAIQQEQGIRRFAQGEGAATRDEIADIDQAVGMDRVNADEGMKNLMRIDKVAQYYLMRGEKDKAEAASASLLQYGAVQVRQSAVMAQAAFEHWQQSGDPNDLRRASMAIQRAHQFIPDGMDMKIDVDPQTRQIVATVTDANGKAQQHVVDPQAVPALMKQAMDGSAYWEAVYDVGQPRLAEQEISQRGYAQRQQATRDYEAQKNAREAQEEEYRYRRGIETGASEKERTRKGNEAFLSDWRQRMTEAGPAEKPAVMQEGLQYTFDNTPNRRSPVDSTTFAPPADTPIEEADNNTIRGIAQMIATKNGQLDGPAAMEAATALVTTPNLQPGRNGTLDVGGLNLVFNPQLLPQLMTLRKKYKQAQ